MKDPARPKSRRRGQLTRRFTLLLMRLGITSEMVAVSGMGLGILAGIAFMATGETTRPNLCWALGAAFCLLRIVAIRLDRALEPASLRQSREEEFYNELPERVSDAVTLIGFGFAVDSNPWLGLGSALAAIFSAYIRSIASSRESGRKIASLGLMKRRHRLFLLAGASFLTISGVPRHWSDTFLPLPQIVLWIVIAGCLVTVILRWTHLRGIKL